jgi:hypothetical protein
MAHTGDFGGLAAAFARGGRRTAVVVDEDKEDSEAITKKRETKSKEYKYL